MHRPFDLCRRYAARQERAGLVGPVLEVGRPGNVLDVVPSGKSSAKEKGRLGGPGVQLMRPGCRRSLTDRGIQRPLSVGVKSTWLTAWAGAA